MSKIFAFLLVFLCILATSKIDAIIPDGFYWEKNDFIHTNSEDLYFTYKYKPGEDSQIKAGVKFKIYDKTGQLLTQGTSSECEKKNKLAVFKILPAEKMRKWISGWYQFKISPQKKPQWFEMRFYHQNTNSYKKVCYFLDNTTPEGYADWLNNGLKIEALRSFQVNFPDLVVISHWNKIEKDILKKLINYANRGGTIVMFGANAPEFDVLSPLKIDRNTPFNYTPEKLNIFKKGCNISVEDWIGLANYSVNASLNTESVGWVYRANGQPFLAEKKYGKGKIYAVASALKPGQVYNTIISSLLGVRPSLGKTKKSVQYSDISLNNVGRFGWLNNDRINAIGIQSDHSWRMWDFKQDTFKVEFAGSSKGSKEHLFCLDANWLSKHLRGTGGGFGQQTDIYFGLGTPGVLYRNQNARSVTIRIPNCNNLAYSIKKGTKTISLKPGVVVKPANMNHNWLLIWAGDYYGINWPVLICVNRKIVDIKQVKRGSISIHFARRGIDIGIMPLAGIQHFTEDQVEPWNDKLPQTIVEQANLWSRLQACRTINCSEEFKVDWNKRTVNVRSHYEYLKLKDDWKTKPLEMAPVPPLLPLCVSSGMVTLSEKVKDTGYRTFQGPLFARLNSSSTLYKLKLPDLSYPLATNSDKVTLNSRLSLDLLDRICKHVAKPGLNYLPIKYHYVGKEKGKIYSVRDLVPACFNKVCKDIVNKKFIDLHRSLGGTFGLIMFKPYLDSTKNNNETKKIINKKIKRNVIRDIEFFQYKTFIRYRVEPNAGEKYLSTFIYPVRFNDGYRIFHDNNETAGIVLYAIYLYAKIFNDDDFLRSNIQYIDAIGKYLMVFNDWSWMSSIAVEWGMGNNIDMLNSEFPAWVALYNIKKRLGVDKESDFAAYMAARTAVSQVARFFFGKYYNSIYFPDVLKLKPVIHEQAGLEQNTGHKSGYLPYGLASGYGEGWPSLWPNRITKSYLHRYATGIDIYNTSKGVSIEAIGLYNNPAVMKVLDKYEACFRKESFLQNVPFCYSRIACYGWLTENKAQVIEDLNRILGQKRNSVSALGSGTANWEISSMTILLELLQKFEDAGKK